jgi:peptide deformylase
MPKKAAARSKDAAAPAQKSGVKISAKNAAKTNPKDGGIVSEGHPALREVSKEIPLEEIGSSHIKSLILDMKKALASQGDGIGLAAPQIGIPLRIFLVSKRIFGKDESGIPADDLVFINPTIIKESKEKKWMEGEGCLSVRWVYGKVKRSTKVTIRAYNEHGQVFERGASGLLAHIFQHEVDHLNGILFIDKAKDLERVDPAELEKSRKEAEKAAAQAAKKKSA